MSGAGRQHGGQGAWRTSAGYVVDNLPPTLLLARWSSSVARTRAATIQPHRRGRRRAQPARSSPTSASRSPSSAGRGHRPRVVFLEATDEVLVRRFESVRRPHPLQGDGRLLDGIAARARRCCASCAPSADLVIDTSDLNVHQLARQGSPSCSAATDAARLRVDGDVVRLQVRPPARRRLRRRLPLPAQPVLGARAAAADRPRRAGARLRAGPAGRRASSSTTYVRAASAPSATGYLREGKRLRHARRRLHRRQAPQRRDGRGARRPAARPTASTPSLVHRDLGRE